MRVVVQRAIELGPGARFAAQRAAREPLGIPRVREQGGDLGRDLLVEHVLGEFGGVLGDREWPGDGRRGGSIAGLAMLATRTGKRSA